MQRGIVEVWLFLKEEECGVTTSQPHRICIEYISFLYEQTYTPSFSQNSSVILAQVKKELEETIHISNNRILFRDTYSSRSTL